MSTTAVLIAALALVALFSAGAPVVSAAESRAVADVAFDGRAELPARQCPEQAHGRPCEGRWSGRFTGTLSGVHVAASGASVPWSILVDLPAGMTLTEVSDDRPTDCSQGVLNGRGEFAGGVNQVWGAYGNVAAVPAAVEEIRVALAYEWRRAATASVLDITAMSVELAVDGIGWVNVVDGAQEISTVDAVAAFIPEAPVDCAANPPATPVGELTGTVSGLVVRAD